MRSAQEAFELGAACMLPEPLAEFKTRAFTEVDHALAGLFTDASALRSWNPLGMRRFGTDIDALLQFAGKHKHERTFARVDDLCSFLTREQWHLAANPDHLSASYPNMDPVLVCAICPVRTDQACCSARLACYIDL